MQSATPRIPETLLDSVVQGDCLEILPRVPEGSVHLAITSPPYNVGLGYDTHDDAMAYDRYLAWLKRVWEETKRVLVPGGRAVHIVPTPAWRLWTSLGHYCYLVKVLLGKREVLSVAEMPSVSEVTRRRGLLYLMRRALIASPHGEYPTAISELYYYSRRRWHKAFTDNGFAVVKVDTTGLFYTGYTLFPSLGVAARKRMARYLGSACHVFVLRAARS